jgi:hypothetical protein
MNGALIVRERSKIEPGLSKYGTRVDTNARRRTTDAPHEWRVARIPETGR